MEKILIIDDEPLVLSSIEKALLKVGYPVTAVSNSESFRNAVTANDFELLIMDVHIKGVDTNELIRMAKAVLPKAKLLTISGSVPSQDSRYFLQKPFRINELRKKVREILDESL